MSPPSARRSLSDDDVEQKKKDAEKFNKMFNRVRKEVKKKDFQDNVKESVNTEVVITCWETC